MNKLPNKEYKICKGNAGTYTPVSDINVAKYFGQALVNGVFV